MDENPYRSPVQSRLVPAVGNRAWFYKPFHPLTVTLVVLIASCLVAVILTERPSEQPLPAQSLSPHPRPTGTP
jgi:hypothetical protein